MTMRSYAICLLALGTYASSVQAGCVTNDDMANGVIVTYGDGTVETHRQNTPDLVAIAEVNRDGWILNWDLAKGVYYIRHTVWIQGRPAGDQGYTIDYGLPPSDLPSPKPGEIWETSSSMHLFPFDPYQQEEVFTYGELNSVEIGDCAYEAIAIENTSTVQGDVSMIGALFLPEVGTSFTVEVDGAPWRQPVSLVAADR